MCQGETGHREAWRGAMTPLKPWGREGIYREEKVWGQRTWRMKKLTAQIVQREKSLGTKALRWDGAQEAYLRWQSHTQNMPPPHSTHSVPRESSAGMTQREGVSGEEGSTTCLGFPRPALYTSQDSLITVGSHWKILWPEGKRFVSHCTNSSLLILHLFLSHLPHDQLTVSLKYLG